MPSPSPVRRELGSALESVRTVAHISQRALAKQLNMSQAMVSRVESGDRLLGRPEVLAWLRACRPVPAATRTAILALVRAAHSDTRDWDELQAASGGSLQNAAAEWNAAAAIVDNVQTIVLPGLLQTPAYARRAIAAAWKTSGRTGDLDAEVAKRLTRQSVLREPGHRFAFVIAEHLLRFVPGPPDPGGDEWKQITVPQLHHLLEAAALDSVELAVLPSTYGATLARPFIVREPANGEPAFVTVELLHANPEFREPDVVAKYRAEWARLLAAAWTGAAALGQIERVLDIGAH